MSYCSDSDMAGGSNPSILDAIRHSLSTSIANSFSDKNFKPLSYHEAFYLATMGGAKGAYNISFFNLSYVGLQWNPS